MKSTLAIAISFGALLFVIGLGVSYYSNAPYREVRQLVASLKTEKQVIDQLGTPRHIFFANDKNHVIEGYSSKNRKISNKLLVYFPQAQSSSGFDIILYVYVDASGQVEDYYVGGS
jgi:hypothetical protein